MSNTIYTQLTTPDKTTLVSKHRHDFQQYTDANGKVYFIDGGNDYCRASMNGDEQFFTVTTDDPFEVRRKYTLWGSRGKCGTKPLTRTALADMTTEHIINVLTYLADVTKDCAEPHKYIKYFNEELTYREKHSL